MNTEYKLFHDWWMNGGSEKWAKALDADGGTVGALEMVFNSGVKAAQKESPSEFSVVWA